MKPSHRLATSVAAIAAVAAALLAPMASGSSYLPVSGPQAGTIEAPMSSGALVRRAGNKRLSVRTSPTVTVGHKLVVVGRGTLRRAPVVLQVNQAGRWRRVDRARTNARGTFRVSEVVTREGEHRFRVVVSPRRGRDATASFRVSARRRGSEPSGWPTEEPTPAPTPAVVPPAPMPTSGAGDPADWSYITGGEEPMAWNSCSTITWGYDPAGEYAGALADWQRAFDIVAERSGLTFEHVGTSGELNVSWSDAEREPRLAGGVVGYGGPSYRYIDPSKNNGVRMLITGGRVLLDREARLAPGHATRGRAAWGQVMVHELMHVVGLGHARGREQIMYPATGALVLGAGDLSGLYDVGSSRGCLSADHSGDAPMTARYGGEVLVADELRDLH